MESLSNKNYFNKQYRREAFFSPKDIQFAIYDKNIWILFKKLLKNAKTIVDLGAGGGTVLYNVSKITKAELIAVDFSDVAVEYLKRVVPNIIILKEDVIGTSLRDQSCDFVVSTMTIEHVDEDNFMKEVFRILKPKGYLLVTTVLKKKNAKYFYRNSKGDIVLEPTHVKEYESCEQFVKLLKKNSFSIVSLRMPRIKFPLIDLLIKIIFRFFKSNCYNKFLVSNVGEFLRKISRVPIPGYYAIEVIAKKEND